MHRSEGGLTQTITSFKTVQVFYLFGTWSRNFVVDLVLQCQKVRHPFLIIVHPRGRMRALPVQDIPDFQPWTFVISRAHTGSAALQSVLALRST